MSYPAAPTPSSEIIHLVGTFTDTLDALPPSLTRSLSDLKELDAVLSGEPLVPPSQRSLLRCNVERSTDGNGVAQARWRILRRNWKRCWK